MRVRVLIWVMVLVVVRMTDEVKKCRQLRRREVKSRPPLLLYCSLTENGKLFVFAGPLRIYHLQ